MIDDSIVKRAVDPQWRAEVDRQALEVIDRQATIQSLNQIVRTARERQRAEDALALLEYSRQAMREHRSFTAGIARQLADLIAERALTP